MVPTITNTSRFLHMNSRFKSWLYLLQAKVSAILKTVSVFLVELKKCPAASSISNPFHFGNDDNDKFHLNMFFEGTNERQMFSAVYLVAVVCPAEVCSTLFEVLLFLCQRSINYTTPPPPPPPADFLLSVLPL